MIGGFNNTPLVNGSKNATAKMKKLSIGDLDGQDFQIKPNYRLAFYSPIIFFSLLFSYLIYRSLFIDSWDKTIVNNTHAPSNQPVRAVNVSEFIPIMNKQTVADTGRFITVLVVCGKTYTCVQST